MRKFLITAVVGAAIGVSGVLAMPSAKAVSSCPTGPTPSWNGGTGGSLTVGTPVGCATLQGDGASQSGSAVVDGNGTIPGPVGGGYIGIDDSDGQGTVVGCADGEYNPNGYNDSTNPAPDADGDGQPDESENHVIVSQSVEPGAPEGPCSPSAP